MKKRDCKERDAKKNMINLKILNDCFDLVRAVPEHEYEVLGRHDALPNWGLHKVAGG
ncbi:MAG: hypothetical protein ACLP5H_32825 [Desulfomonilaceae bacterium]